MTIRVKKTEGKPESTEILAEAITRISDSMEKLLASGVNMNAIIILISHDTKLGKATIKKVFDSMKRLKGWYCR